MDARHEADLERANLVHAVEIDLDHALPETVMCPFCEESDTEQFSAFGSALSVSQYYCRRCRTVFEWMRRSAGGPKGRPTP